MANAGAPKDRSNTHAFPPLSGTDQIGSVKGRHMHMPKSGRRYQRYRDQPDPNADARPFDKGVAAVAISIIALVVAAYFGAF